jgi:hypothetical protein
MQQMYKSNSNRESTKRQASLGVVIGQTGSRTIQSSMRRQAKCGLRHGPPRPALAIRFMPSTCTRPKHQEAHNGSEELLALDFLEADSSTHTGKTLTLQEQGTFISCYQNGLLHAEANIQRQQLSAKPAAITLEKLMGQASSKRSMALEIERGMTR